MNKDKIERRRRRRRKIYEGNERHTKEMKNKKYKKREAGRR